MSLILNEWVAAVADARSKREMADALARMPVFTIVVYHATLIQRLNVKGFPEAAKAVEVTRRLMTSPRPDTQLMLDDAAAWDEIEKALAAEAEADAAADRAAAQGLDAELSAIGL